MMRAVLICVMAIAFLALDQGNTQTTQPVTIAVTVANMSITTASINVTSATKVTGNQTNTTRSGTVTPVSTGTGIQTTKANRTIASNGTGNGNGTNGELKDGVTSFTASSAMMLISVLAASMVHF